MKKVLFAWVALIGLMCHQAQAQMIIDTWNMTTGVDTTLWYDISGVDSVIIASGNIFSMCSGVRNIGFDFTLGVSTYSQFSTNINGTVRLGSTPVPSSGGYSNALNQSNGPKIEPFGWRGKFDDNCYTRMALLGTAGNRVRVVETRMKDYTFIGDSLYVSFQVQLFETGGFRVVYGESDSGAVHSASSVRLQNGVSATVNNNNRDIIFFDFATHEAVRLNTTCSLYNTAELWPEKGRWYNLEPDASPCPYPGNITVVSNNPDSTVLSWPAVAGAGFYLTIANADIDSILYDTSICIMGMLNGTTTYSGTLQTMCSDGSESYRMREFSFTTANGPDTFCITPEEPYLAARDSLIVRVEWTDNSNLSWEVSRTAPGGDPDTGLITPTTNPYIEYTDINDDSIYYVYVRGYCETGIWSGWSDWSTPCLIDSIPTPPTPPDPPVGITHIETADFMLSPNPTDGTVQILGLQDELTDIDVLDMTGRLLKTFEKTATFNISTLSSGIYIVRVKTHHDNTETITYFKLVKK